MLDINDDDLSKYSNAIDSKIEDHQVVDQHVKKVVSSRKEGDTPGIMSACTL